MCSVAAILDDVLTQLWFASARTGVVGMLLWLPTSFVIVGKKGVHQIGEMFAYLIIFIQTFFAQSQ